MRVHRGGRCGELMSVALAQEHGASLVRHVKEPGGEWSVLTDPEGNEFCVA